jgi:hypothetical protein
MNNGPDNCGLETALIEKVRTTKDLQTQLQEYRANWNEFRAACDQRNRRAMEFSRQCVRCVRRRVAVLLFTEVLIPQYKDEWRAGAREQFAVFLERAWRTIASLIPDVIEWGPCINIQKHIAKFEYMIFALNREVAAQARPNGR